MSRQSKELELRLRALEYLSGEEFRSALANAKDYHEKHPPLEILGEPKDLSMTQTNVDRLERKKGLIEEVNESTRAKLLDSHRKRLMQYFRGYRKIVPDDLAGEIADVIIATEPDRQCFVFEQSPCA